jgi:signal transduction histidine kinase
MHQTVAPSSAELAAALLQALITLGAAMVCGFLYRRHRKPYLVWFAVAWLLYVLRLGAIATFLLSGQWVWLYWHQVVTGWTALALLWAALLFLRRPRRRWTLPAAALFPPVWSYVAIYRLDSFLLAAMPAVLFLSLVTFGTGWVFLRYHRLVRSPGAALLAGALMLWGLHHLDYPFLRARGAWTPWGYYLDILFTAATTAGIVLLVLDDVRRGLAALLTVSGDLARSALGEGPERLLERLLALPAVRGTALYVAREGRIERLHAAGACALWGLPPTEETARVAETLARGEPQTYGDWPSGGTGAAFRFAAVLPIFREVRATHALLIVGDARDPFAALDTNYLVALGQQIGTALRGAELRQRLELRTAELERLSHRMLSQHEEERRRLSLHLHDETAQVFTAVKLQLGVLREQQPDPALQARLAALLALMDEGIEGIRNVTNDLRPALLDDLGLLPALRSLANAWSERSGVRLEMTVPSTLPPLASDAELALFRALQESLSNIGQHAGAAHVEVVVRAGDGIVSMDVADDGDGFPDGGAVVVGLERAGHLGLAGMRERITALGGDVALGGAAGGGARVTVWVPTESA